MQQQIAALTHEDGLGELLAVGCPNQSDVVMLRLISIRMLKSEGLTAYMLAGVVHVVVCTLHKAVYKAPTFGRCNCRRAAANVRHTTLTGA